MQEARKTDRTNSVLKQNPYIPVCQRNFFWTFWTSARELFSSDSRMSNYAHQAIWSFLFTKHTEAHALFGLATIFLQGMSVFEALATLNVITFSSGRCSLGEQHFLQTARSTSTCHSDGIRWHSQSSPLFWQQPDLVTSTAAMVISKQSLSHSPTRATENTRLADKGFPDSVDWWNGRTNNGCATFLSGGGGWPGRGRLSETGLGLDSCTSFAPALRDVFEREFCWCLLL